MSFEPRFDKNQIRAKFEIWLGHRTAREFTFQSGYDNFSIIQVVEK